MRCIVIVDDNVEAREYLQQLLSDGWQVEIAADGETGFHIAKRCRAELIFADVLMLGTAGFELLLFYSGQVLPMTIKARYPKVPLLLKPAVSSLIIKLLTNLKS